MVIIQVFRFVIYNVDLEIRFSEFYFVMGNYFSGTAMLHKRKSV